MNRKIKKSALNFALAFEKLINDFEQVLNIFNSIIIWGLFSSLKNIVFGAPNATRLRALLLHKGYFRLNPLLQLAGQSL